MHAKFVGFFRLVDACAGVGCPICRCLVGDGHHYLDTILYEHVTDPALRADLHASWGFCNWHSWMLQEASDPAFGSAILFEDLLGGIIRRFEGRACARMALGRPAGPRGPPAGVESGTRSRHGDVPAECRRERKQ